MISLNDYGFGPRARNRLAAATDTAPAGAVAALETFYYALNQRDVEAMRAVWSQDDLAQLNNPVGGIVRGGAQAVALYERIFDSGVQLEVTFGDAATYEQPSVVVFAGTETGWYALEDQSQTPLRIRTSRVFGFDDRVGRWVQLHHHGSIDDPEALRAYQKTVAPA